MGWNVGTEPAAAELAPVMETHTWQDTNAAKRLVRHRKREAMRLVRQRSELPKRPGLAALKEPTNPHSGCERFVLG